MTFTTKTVAAVVCFSSFASPLLAAEGFLMVEKTVSGTTERITNVQVEPQRMRAEMTNAAGATQIVLFDSQQQVLRIINMANKSYTELTKADADRIGAQVSAAMEGMKEKLAQMPPEQRAKMEAMMARIGGAPGATPQKPDFRPAGKDMVGKWECDKYEGFRNNEKVTEVCTVDPKVLGLTPADFEVSKQVAAFFQKMVPIATDQIVGIGTIETQGFNGIPVRRSTYRQGKVVSTSEVVKVGRQNFPASSYEVPEGFTKQAAPMQTPK
jgi:hypothetical protein